MMKSFRLWIAALCVAAPAVALFLLGPALFSVAPTIPSRWTLAGTLDGTDDIVSVFWAFGVPAAGSAIVAVAIAATIDAQETRFATPAGFGFLAFVSSATSLFWFGSVEIARQHETVFPTKYLAAVIVWTAVTFFVAGPKFSR